MKEIVTRRDGSEDEIELIASDNFSNISNVFQVYGLLFTEDKKLCIVNPEGRWTLPGGGIEADESFEECLIRESSEEADIEISNLKTLGYLKVTSLSKKMK